MAGPESPTPQGRSAFSSDQWRKMPCPATKPCAQNGGSVKPTGGPSRQHPLDAPAGQWMGPLSPPEPRRDEDALCGPAPHGTMARNFDRQATEFQVRVAVLNGFTAPGIPATETVRNRGKGNLGHQTMCATEPTPDLSSVDFARVARQHLCSPFGLHAEAQTVHSGKRNPYFQRYKVVLMVGARRFELPTYGTQNRRATRLRYAPTLPFLTCLARNEKPLAHDDVCISKKEDIESPNLRSAMRPAVR